MFYVVVIPFCPRKAALKLLIEPLRSGVGQRIFLSLKGVTCPFWPGVTSGHPSSEITKLRHQVHVVMELPKM